MFGRENLTSTNSVKHLLFKGERDVASNGTIYNSLKYKDLQIIRCVNSRFFSLASLCMTKIYGDQWRFFRHLMLYF